MATENKAYHADSELAAEAELTAPATDLDRSLSRHCGQPPRGSDPDADRATSRHAAILGRNPADYAAHGSVPGSRQAVGLSCLGAGFISTWSANRVLIGIR